MELVILLLQEEKDKVFRRLKYLKQAEYPAELSGYFKYSIKTAVEKFNQLETAIDVLQKHVKNGN